MMWWDDQQIESTVTRDFVTANLQQAERKLLDKPVAFGDLSDDTYIEWILEKTKRIFLILKELGVTDQIRYIVDDSWDDDDLPLPLEAIQRLNLTHNRDETMEKRFYKTQFRYLLRPVKEGEHMVYDADEVVPVEPVSKRPGFSFDHTLEKVHIPGQDEVYMRRRIVLGNAAGKVSGEDFVYEVQKMKSIVHQHIISLRASYTYHGCGYVLLSPASDISLKGFFQVVPQQFKVLAKPQRRQTLMTWLHCLIDALAFLHRHGLAHNDIRPSTIMIDESNSVFFADIGGFKQPDVDKKPHDIELYEYGAPERWVRGMAVHESSSPTKYSSGGKKAFPTSPSPDKFPVGDTQSIISSPAWTGSSAIVNEWRNTFTDPHKSDVFSLACVWLDIVTFLLKRKSNSFSSHRSAKNKKPGRGGGQPDASFHANIGQLESWINILEKSASKKNDKVFGAIPPVLKLARRMLSRDPNMRPWPRECEKHIYNYLVHALDPEKPHCGIHQISDGHWDFGDRSSVSNSDMTSFSRNSGTSSSMGSNSPTTLRVNMKSLDSPTSTGETDRIGTAM
jgi:serine/threonine protein kinase